MIRKKSKGWTFIFSLLPGAGEMYMGFMKQGLSLMTIFATLCAVGIWLDIKPLLVCSHSQFLILSYFCKTGKYFFLFFAMFPPRSQT